MKLINPTDRELDEAFAEHVAGWKVEFDGDKKYLSPDGENWHMWSIPYFTGSVDLVLPWLEKFGGAVYVNRYTGWGDTNWAVRLYENDEDGSLMGEAEEPTLPRAAMIALLRAHGVEIEFT